MFPNYSYWVQRLPLLRGANSKEPLGLSQPALESPLCLQIALTERIAERLLNLAGTHSRLIL